MQMPIPDDWDGTTFCEYSVCWPKSLLWKNILRGLATNPIKGRFWDASTGGIVDTQNAFLPALVHNLDLPEVIMSCANSEIADALNNIAIALNASASATATSGCGSCGANGAGQSAPPIDPTVPPTDQEGPPPEGFDSWEQYNANRCAVATDLINKALGSVNNMSIINLAGLTIVSLIPILVPLMLDVVPGDELAVIGGVLLAILAFGTALIDSVSDTILDHKDELICELYSNRSVGEAEAAVEAKFAEVYDADHPGVPYFYGAVQIFNSLLNPANLNRLIVLNTAVTLPAGDCSTCVPICVGCLAREDSTATVIATLDVNGGPIILDSLSEFGYHSIILTAQGDDIQITFSDLTGHTDQGGNDFRIGEVVNEDIISTDDFSAFQTAALTACITPPASGFGQWELYSSTPFSVTIDPVSCT